MPPGPPSLAGSGAGRLRHERPADDEGELVGTTPDQHAQEPRRPEQPERPRENPRPPDPPPADVLRRLAPSPPLTPPSVDRRVLAVASLPVGVAASLFGGASPGLVAFWAVAALLAGAVAGSRPFRPDAVRLSVTVGVVLVVPSVAPGLPEAWNVLTTSAGVFCGATLGSWLRSRADARAVRELAPPTEPGDVPGRTVLGLEKGRLRWEAVDPSPGTIEKAVRKQRDQQVFVVELRRGQAGMFLLRDRATASFVLQADDAEEGPWREALDTETVPVEGEPYPRLLGARELRRRSVAAAVHFARTGERTTELPWGEVRPR